MKRLILWSGLIVLLAAVTALGSDRSERIYDQSRGEPTPVVYPQGNRDDLLFESFEDEFPPDGWIRMWFLGNFNHLKIIFSTCKDFHYLLCSGQV